MKTQTNDQHELEALTVAANEAFLTFHAALWMGPPSPEFDRLRAKCDELRQAVVRARNHIAASQAVPAGTWMSPMKTLTIQQAVDLGFKVVRYGFGHYYLPVALPREIARGDFTELAASQFDGVPGGSEEGEYLQALEDTHGQHGVVGTIYIVRAVYTHNDGVEILGVYGAVEVESTGAVNARRITEKAVAALEQAVLALNTKPRFKVRETDSYQIAALCDEAIAKAKGTTP